MFMFKVLVIQVKKKLSEKLVFAPTLKTFKSPPWEAARMNCNFLARTTVAAECICGGGKRKLV